LIFGDEVPHWTTMFRWFSEFDRGRYSLKDEFREVCPKSVILPENIDAVRKMIKLDHYVTYRKIKAPIGMNSTSVHSILHENVVVKKICQRWIPYNLTTTQKSLV